MKIYFATANNNDPKVKAIQQKFITVIKRYGQILNPWKTDSTLMTSNNQHPDQRVHDETVRQLEIADVLIAEISQPSLGVGYELCLAEQLDIPTVILYNSQITKPSAIIAGARKLNVVSYHKWQQAKKILINFLNEFK